MDGPVTTAGGAGQTRTATVLWGPSPGQRRGPKPKLSRELIVGTALAIGDAEGLAALSMQRLSDELGCAKMALYRHVPGKAELTALMLDAAIGPPPPTYAAPQDWRLRLRTWATALFAIFSRRPWTLEISTGVRVLGPNELGWLETGVGALSHTGLSGAERLDAVVLVLGHVRNLAQQGASAPDPAAVTERDLATVMSGILTEHGDDYPHVRAAFAEASRDAGQDDALDFGLARILDGLAALIDGRGEHGPHRPGGAGPGSG
ncbi:MULTISPECIES: TetR/AcrR family transcriptional regulator [Pseudonocardia]|uniref:HTH tetR-type domain-containing protein n=2 Tax=Pseudonocardia TaxID=1847 RepID=A0A1Y2N263_PSEAH|nr:MULTISPECIES: TetR/AcrR family transcriptional regulator C-terminal domain-containing protein [Pseudonocardia]OSY41556.1 hypothetical protein BG845_02047 [Pseudonocardia autotrophica]TDN71511.1 TetR family transcriptional regulator [Pseudonocardia autotrophica]BBG02190.1 TetR family transcriptional regulator [Pseudonocardia autotrophica]GEC24204.1 TetR family transcriptional regulator [Pseudonocardia saturnea]